MAEAPKYLVDSSVYIDAKNFYYAFDIAPRFWSHLRDQATSGRIRSIDKIKAELKREGDQLSDWVQDVCPHAFDESTEPAIIDAYRQILDWARAQQQYRPSAFHHFAGCADGWLVAYAWVHGFTVVTREKYEPNAQREIKIPNVCHAFSVQMCNPFEMLRQLGLTLG